MSDKKCKICGSGAEWEFDTEWYCECCMCIEFDVQWIDAPRRCEMCGDALDRVYYTDSEGTPFCSAKCALEYNDARVISAAYEQEEQEDDRQL